MKPGLSDWCDISQDAYDDFDWIIWTGLTPSDNTGPVGSHDGQYYIYIEASEPRKPGDKAMYVCLIEKPNCIIYILWWRKGVGTFTEGYRKRDEEGKCSYPPQFAAFKHFEQRPQYSLV